MHKFVIVLERALRSVKGAGQEGLRDRAVKCWEFT